MESIKKGPFAQMYRLKKLDWEAWNLVWRQKVLDRELGLFSVSGKIRALFCNLNGRKTGLGRVEFSLKTERAQ